MEKLDRPHYAGTREYRISNDSSVAEKSAAKYVELNSRSFDLPSLCVILKEHSRHLTSEQKRGTFTDLAREQAIMEIEIIV